MKLLDDSIQRLKNAVEKNPDIEQYSLSEDRLHDYTKVRGHNLPSNECVARLRLDWEIDGLNPDKVKIFDPMMDIMKLDLEDLIINGDVEARDALLTSIKGEKIRGQKAVEVDIFQATFFKEWKEKKNTTEWTVYILMYVKFE